MNARSLAVSAVFLVVACTKKQPGPVLTPMQQEALDQAIWEQLEDPPDDIFVGMAVAATGWTKGSIGAGTVGIFQPDGADPRMRRAIEAATTRYALRPIGPSDYAVVCGGNAPARTSITSRSAKCSMKYVDAVIAFNTVMMGRDSGYVGLNVTRVPNGADRLERVNYCITLVRKVDQWEAKRGERALDRHRCPRGIP